MDRMAAVREPIALAVDDLAVHLLEQPFTELGQALVFERRGGGEDFAADRLNNIGTRLMAADPSRSMQADIGKECRQVPGRVVSGIVVIDSCQGRSKGHTSGQRRRFLRQRRDAGLHLRPAGKRRTHQANMACLRIMILQGPLNPVTPLAISLEEQQVTIFIPEAEILPGDPDHPAANFRLKID